MTEHGETRRAHTQFKARLKKTLEGMTEEERDALRISFPFPGPEDAGTAEGAEDKELRRRRHPRRKGPLREFIEGAWEDSE